MAAGLRQHPALRQANQVVPQRCALAGPGRKLPITFKGFQKAF